MGKGALASFPLFWGWMENRRGLAIRFLSSPWSSHLPHIPNQMKTHQLLPFLSALVCWLTLSTLGVRTIWAQSVQHPAYFTYFDNFLSRGYFPLSSDSLGNVYFERMGLRKDSRYATLHVAGRDIGTGYLPHDTSGSTKCIDIDAGKLRTFSQSFSWGYSEVWFSKGASHPKSWRFQFWSHFTRDQVTKIIAKSDTPYRRIRHLRPEEGGFSFDMPDTSRIHFEYQVKTYVYKDSLVEWTHVTWDVDRRNPRKVIRLLESRYVWRYRLPKPDPDHVMGPWGHDYARHLGELVEQYNRFDSLPIPPARRRRALVRH